MIDTSGEFSYDCSSKKSSKISLITDINTGEIMCANCGYVEPLKNQRKL